MPEGRLPPPSLSTAGSRQRHLVLRLRCRHPAKPRAALGGRVKNLLHVFHRTSPSRSTGEAAHWEVCTQAKAVPAECREKGLEGPMRGHGHARRPDPPWTAATPHRTPGSSASYQQNLSIWFHLKVFRVVQNNWHSMVPSTSDHWKNTKFHCPPPKQQRESRRAVQACKNKGQRPCHF